MDQLNEHLEALATDINILKQEEPSLDRNKLIKEKKKLYNEMYDEMKILNEITTELRDKELYHIFKIVNNMNDKELLFQCYKEYSKLEWEKKNGNN